MIVVCGSGRTLFDDLNRARIHAATHEIIAVNGAVYGLDEFEHIASLHSAMIHHWRYAKGARNDCGKLSPLHVCTTHSCQHDVDVDRVHKGFPIQGGSVLFAVQLALRILGASEVLLCGVPHTCDGRFYDMPGAYNYPGDWQPWLDAKDLFPGSIHSMSGKTKELFGDG